MNILLIIICTILAVTKLYSKKKLRDIDGLGEVITSVPENTNVILSFKSVEEDLDGFNKLDTKREDI
ncbi:hypothetical protein PSN82_002749 [Enterococcus faecalis]|uniref:hypothetical protein n=1 Tax=Enterococcus faecalis TaxID=1351 RepID=UPI001783B829|nr:hypothetical protein [Enterococcus faecalis]EJG4482921.1 hypothetical protein [Enterococcus faecalis]EKL7559091.1 hypothetical protein [Enterococcus faecalis]MBD9844074.1 hypothetical protein [Enterococcus faecalis]MDR9788634.1 hypothetical protein [Enterococcus faecalis]HBI1614228.1 hypothetical protein [Enterococcus faecalis]